MRSDKCILIDCQRIHSERKFRLVGQSVGQSDRHNRMPVYVLLSIKLLPHAVGSGSPELCLCGLHYAGELNMHRFEGVVWSNR